MNKPKKLTVETYMLHTNPEKKTEKKKNTKTKLNRSLPVHQCNQKRQGDGWVL